MKKFMQVKKTINGIEYTAQFNGALSHNRALDYARDGENIMPSSEKMTLYLLENVLVSPVERKSEDAYENFNELSEVVEFLTEVNQGIFREEEEQKPVKARSKE
ncbi:MAG: hypothetical protein ACLT5F_09085 [Anaerotignaceae bacterium]